MVDPAVENLAVSVSFVLSPLATRALEVILVSIACIFGYIFIELLFEALGDVFRPVFVAFRRWFNHRRFK